MLESTFLSRSFSDQGVRLRVRKEPRILGKRPAQADLPSTQFSPADNSASMSRQESLGIQSPPTHGGGYTSTYRNPAARYEPPSSKRQKPFYPGPVGDSAYQQSQRSDQGMSSEHFNLYSYNPSGEAPSSSRSSLHSQGAQPALAYPSEYSYGHRHTGSSNVASPSGPHEGTWGRFPHATRPTSMQYPSREGNRQHLYGQDAPLQPQQPPQFIQPVPPERQLPSSVPTQHDNNRSLGQLERQASYGINTFYAQSYDDRRGTYPQSQTYTTAQDPYSQILPRTLPPPSQQSSTLASIGSTAPSAYSYSTTQQPLSSSTPPSSSDYATSAQGYQQGQYQGQQGYRNLLSRRATPSILSPVSITPLKTSDQSDTSPSRPGSCSSSNTTASDRTVEVHDQRHTGWELRDVESEIDAVGSDWATKPRQRSDYEGPSGSRSCRLMLGENDMITAEVQPHSSPCEDATVPTSDILAVQARIKNEDIWNTSLLHNYSPTGEDISRTMRIYEATTRPPSLIVTAPNGNPVIPPQPSTYSSIETKTLYDSPVVSMRQASAASAFSSSSPRDSPKMWLRRDISSGRYYMARAVTPPALAIQRITAFDMTSEIFAVPTMGEEECVMVRYNARLSFIGLKDMERSETSSLEIAVGHAGPVDQQFHLERGDNLVLLMGNHKLPIEEPEKSAIITIVRHRVDLEEPINVYLTVFYPLSQGQTAVRLPFFRPLSGTVRLECVFVKEPCLPLVVEPSLKDDSSTWNVKAQDGDGIVFDRIATVPRPFPEMFADNVSVRFRRLQPANFPLLAGLHPASAIIWNLTMTAGKALGSDIYCDVRIDLAVGQSQQLLIIDTHGWSPIYCLLNGQPAVRGSKHWVKDEGERYILPKQPYMKEGQAMEVELRWQTPWTRINNAGTTFGELALPCIFGNKVLGGQLTCTLPAAIIKLKNPSSIAHFQTCFNNRIALPVLVPDHVFTLNLSDTCTNNTVPSLSLSRTNTNDTPGSGQIKWADHCNCDMHLNISEPVPHRLIRACDGPLEDIPEKTSIEDDDSDHSSTPSEKLDHRSAASNPRPSEPSGRNWIGWFTSLLRWMGYLSLVILVAQSITKIAGNRGPKTILYPLSPLAIWGSCPYGREWSVIEGFHLCEERPTNIQYEREEQKGIGHIATMEEASELAHEVDAAQEAARKYNRNELNTEASDMDEYLGADNMESLRDKVDRFVGWAWLANHG
ncbi:MAG: hypothetical protein Q9217_005182 [Psora testacea]